MVRTKSSSKKQSSRGVDFKKIKRKIGRKLPPPKNVTNTEIKSKAIVLPEQSVASDKTGLAVSGKGLTLKELLQQTSHHNAKVRKDALIGIKDLFKRHPAELKLHKLAVIEKLRERISDDDKLVREMVYQLFSSVVLPGCKEDNLGALISLAMVYVFNAMTNLSIDVRLMAFKFLDLFIQHHPSTFKANADKVLESYEDILRKNKFHLEDKGKLKIALSGLMRCLSLLSSIGQEDTSAKKFAQRRVLHAYEPDVRKDSAGYPCVTRRLRGIVPVLVCCFDDLISVVRSQRLLDGVSYDCMLCILQSTGYAVRHFAYVKDIYQQEHTPTHFVGSDNFTISQSLLPSLGKLFSLFPFTRANNLSKKDCSRYFILDALISEIFLNLSRRISPSPVLTTRFLEFVEDILRKLSDNNEQQSVEAFSGKHLHLLISHLPRLVSTVDSSSRDHLIQVFTKAFEACYEAFKLKKDRDDASTMKIDCNKYSSKKSDGEQPSTMATDCNQASKMNTDCDQDSEMNTDCDQDFANKEDCDQDSMEKRDSDRIIMIKSTCLLPCVLAIEELLFPRSLQSIDANNPVFHAYLSTWIETLPRILISLGNAHPSFSKVLLNLLLRLGQAASPDSFLGSIYDEIRPLFQGIFGDGPFLTLPKNCQELSICCLNYFSSLDTHFLSSVASCCLCHDLDADILSRIIRVLNSAYKAGRIHIKDLLSFSITLLSQFKVTPQLHEREAIDQKEVRSTQEIYKSTTGVICSFLRQMGDRTLVFQMLEGVAINSLIVPELALDNKCALLRMLATVFSKPAQFSEESTANLSNILCGYLLDVSICFSEESDKNSDFPAMQTCYYYILPCLVMFDSSAELFKSVLDTMKSVVYTGKLTPCHKFNETACDPSSRIRAIVSVFSMLVKDVKMRRSIPSFKQEIDSVLESIVSLQTKEDESMGLEQRHKAKCAVDKFKILIGALFFEGS